MKKLNNKGFAVASILYSIMVLFLILLLSILGILGSRKATLDRNKKEILGILNSEDSSSDVMFKYGSISFKHRNITIINRGNKDDIEFALMDGVKAVDGIGNDIDSSNITYDLDVNNIENKTYNVIYSVNDNGKEITEERSITFVDDISYEFDYTGYSQTFVTDYSGVYRLETWGAQGGSYNEIYYGGYGAYATGQINLEKNNTFYINVGGQGQCMYAGGYTGGGVPLSSTEGGYNGGGVATTCTSATGNQQSCAGGGATHISTRNGVLSSLQDYIGTETSSSYDSSVILMVASGGGGSIYLWNGQICSIGGSGGGFQGGKYITGASDIEESLVSEFRLPSQKLNSYMNFDSNFFESSFGQASGFCSGGGGGLYGGVGAQYSLGGSSYIGSSLLTDKAMYCYGCDPSPIDSTDEDIKTIVASNALATATSNSAKKGNGYAKISVIYYYDDSNENSGFNFEHRNITIINRGNPNEIRYALTDGVSAIDSYGNEIDHSNITYDLNLNNIENKSYKVTYTAHSNGETITGTRIVTFTNENIKYEFDYTGDEQIFVSNYGGSYTVELWGASGGDADNYLGGTGGYASDILELSKLDLLYVVVGGGGESLSSGCSQSNHITYNGGGQSSCQYYGGNYYYGTSGGGATHLATSPGELKDLVDDTNSIVLVAGGGGGASSTNGDGLEKANGGFGGGTSGGDGVNSNHNAGKGATSSFAGETVELVNGVQTASKFGQGCIAYESYSTFLQVSGGGGYYGGGCGCHAGGGGGSGYATNATGILIPGNESMPNPRGSGNVTGNSGNGYARISLIYYY